MKKFISVLLIAIMVMGCLANVAFASADGDGAISGNYVQTQAGTQVTVYFTASDLVYGSYWFEVNTDLEIVSISRGGATAGSFDAYAETGRIASAVSENATANGTLFSVTVNVPADAKAGTQYNVGLKVLEICKVDGESVSPAVGAGVVEVVCDHKYEGTVTKEATCTAEGVMTYTCTVCGDTYTEAIAKTAHTAKDGWEYDENKHWHICSVCGEKFAEADHAWVNVVDKQPTATEDGHSHDECECGAKGAEYTIPATGEDIDDVPSTGDITPYVAMCAIAVLALLTAVTALVFKRKRTN